MAEKINTRMKRAAPGSFRQMLLARAHGPESSGSWREYGRENFRYRYPAKAIMAAFTPAATNRKVGRRSSQPEPACLTPMASA